MKTGVKILIGVGAAGAAAVGYYFWKLNSIDNGQLTMDNSKNTLNRLLETLPAPTKAPATEVQQTQVAKVVAMLNQSGAQAVPIVGQILGGIALVAGFIANGYAKAKAIKDQGAQVDEANRQLIIQNVELDDAIRQSTQQVNAINTEITRLGLSGIELSGLSDFLKKTFTPAKYQQNILDDKVEQNKQLQASAEQKLKTLESIEAELKRVYERLTGGKNLQKVLLIGGGVTVGLTVLYFLNDYFKWIKL